MAKAGTRRTPLRQVSRLALAIIACYLAFVLYIQASERLMRHRAEHLLEVMRDLEVGKSTWADFQEIRAQWGAFGGYQGACTEERCDYMISLSDVAGGRILAILASLLGHGHLASAFLNVTVEQGIVKQTSFHLWVCVPKGYGPRWEHEQPQNPGYVPYSTAEYTLVASASSRLELSQLCCYWPQPVPHRDYVISKPGGCEGCLGIRTSFLPQATKEEKLRMTTFDFNCITKWKPCADEEDIMPGVGTEYERQMQERAIERGRQERCDYSVAELSRAALDAAVARVIHLPDQRPNSNEYVRLQFIRKLSGSEDLPPNETLDFDATGLPTESKQSKLISESFADHKQVIVLYWRDPNGNTVQVYTCGLLPYTEQIARDVISGVNLRKGLQEYE